MTTLIPLKDVATHEALNYDARITAVAIMLEETAVMEALVMVNGKKHGWRKYVEFGGCVRFVDGEPCLVWPDEGLTYPRWGMHR